MCAEIVGFITKPNFVPSVVLGSSTSVPAGGRTVTAIAYD
jgi:hypothetical protein